MKPYEMDFSDALDRNYLVYGDVKELPKQPLQTIKVFKERIEYREQNPEAPAEEHVYYEYMDEWKD